MFAFHLEEAGLAHRVRSLKLPALHIVSAQHEPRNFWTLHAFQLPGLGAAVKYPKSFDSWALSCRVMAVDACSGRMDARARQKHLKAMRAAYAASRWPRLLAGGGGEPLR